MGVGLFSDRSSVPLIGRDDELGLLRAFIATAAESGGALLLSGEPGAGKTALLDAAVTDAEAAGVQVLRATGAEFESALAFAGIHQLLHPLLGELGALDAGPRVAVAVALGLQIGPSPNQLMVSNGVLALLARATASGPLLVVVDDLPWLDRSSALVLGVVARRLAGSRVGFLGAFRTSEGGFFDGNGLRRLDVAALDEAAAAALVGDRFPALAGPVRQRLLTEAQGNPLALLELPIALSPGQRAGAESLPALLPLNHRLQKVFETRVAALPEPTRHLLLLAALDGTGSVPLLLTAARDRAGLADLAAAERVGLVELAEGADIVLFRHPLTRSAVVALAGPDERRGAHETLAGALVDEPDRHAWHLARATLGPDDHVAAALDGVARRNRRRGDAGGAIAALLRAAELSVAGPERARRLAEAAYVGALIAGDLRDVPRLLAEAMRTGGGQAGSLSAAVAAAHHLVLSGDGDIDTAHRLLVAAIEAQPQPYDADDDTLVEALNTLGWINYFGGRAELWAPFHDALGRFHPRTPERLALLEATFADPARITLGDLDRLDAAIAALNHQTDPVQVARVGLASMFLDRLPHCREALQRLYRDGHDRRATTLSLHALSLLGLDHFAAGEWDRVRVLAAEHVRLSEQHNYRLLHCRGIYLQGLLAAAVGDDAAVATAADRITSWAIPRQVLAVQRLAAQIRTLAALGGGRYEEAYQQAASVSPAGELASHVPHALWLILDLTEAAVRTGRHAEAAAHVAAARETGVAAISPRYVLLVEAATAVAADDDEAPGHFATALAVPGAQRWPFDLARVQLLCGERLRRTKATTAARGHLTQSLEAFRRMGAHPWSARASAELRATGLAMTRSGTATAPLTPQQREIAALAAAGLTNKEIAQRLYLSPRTVSTHLYQIFPKLGITSRAALRDALTGHPAPPAYSTHSPDEGPS